MKNILKNYYLLLPFLFLTLIFNCSEVQESKEILTEEKADEIIKKYGLESTFNKQSLNKFNAKRGNDKDVSKNINVGEATEIVTVEQFEALVAAIAKRENSTEGRIAKKMNEFFQLAKDRDRKYTKIEVDSFYKALDNEFGTDLYKQRERLNSTPDVVRFSTFEEIE